MLYMVIILERLWNVIKFFVVIKKFELRNGIWSRLDMVIYSVI